MSVRPSFGLWRACPLGGNGAVLVYGLGLTFELESHPEFATETKAHFRDLFTLSSSDA